MGKKRRERDSAEGAIAEWFRIMVHSDMQVAARIHGSERDTSGAVELEYLH